MARMLLGPATRPAATTVSNRAATPALALSPQQVEMRLRQPRSRAYVDAVSKLDAGGHVHSREALEALLQAVGQEMQELNAQFWPVGYVSKCYLGAPYEVHSLDCTGNIICHYQAGQPLPDGMERARTLARSAHYACIEVYHDKLIAVAANGDVSLIKG